MGIDVGALVGWLVGCVGKDVGKLVGAVGAALGAAVTMRFHQYDDTMLASLVPLFGEAVAVALAGELVGCEGKEVGTLEGAEGAAEGAAVGRRLYHQLEGVVLASEAVSLFGETAAVALDGGLVGYEGNEVGKLDGAEGAAVGVR